MSAATVSSKYRTVIPKEVGRNLMLQPGQMVIIIEKNGVAYLMPEKPLKSMRGFAKEVAAESIREEEDRF